jgi:hypothetical protein
MSGVVLQTAFINQKFILSKKDAVIAGGCFRSNMSMGLGEETHS